MVEIGTKNKKNWTFYRKSLKTLKKNKRLPY